MNDAVISDDELYRYRLRRGDFGLFQEKKPALFVMLNPSTADASLDDPTIRRCRGFAESWNCSGIVVANLYAFRATKPKELWQVADPVGPENDYWLLRLLKEFDTVVCAWGANAKPERVKKFMYMATVGKCKTKCLGITKSGQPKHPLYIKADQPLIDFELRWCFEAH